MGIKCGIVGLPNVGKSTLFNALTRAQIAAENYPFCTIDPNVGIVPVPDPRLDALVEDRRAREDRADHGGVRRHRGPGGRRVAGRGPRQQVPVAHPRDRRHRARGALLRGRRHRARVGRRGSHLATSRSSTPSWRWPICSRWRRPSIATPRRPRVATRTRPASTTCSSACASTSIRASRCARWASRKEEKADSQELHLLTAKPVMYVANVKEDGFTNNAHLDAVTARAKGEGAVVVAVCAAIEAEISQLEEADRADFLKDLGLAEPGLNRVIRAGYELLGLQTYFTAGEKEVRAWTVRAGSTAPQAAGVIHTDFERGFIRAEVIALRRLHQVQGRGRRQRCRQAAARRQGIHRQGRRCHALPLQRLMGTFLIC